MLRGVKREEQAWALALLIDLAGKGGYSVAGKSSKGSKKGKDNKAGKSGGGKKK